MDELARPGVARLRTDRACLALLQSEIDLAFGFLRLAQVESHGGNSAHAADLIAKAALAHKAVLKDLPSLSLESEEEMRELQRSVRKLFETIRAVERLRTEVYF